MNHKFNLKFTKQIQCQIMYKWILKKREYWMKGNILGWFGWEMSGEPMIFPLVQYLLIFNIDLYMIWHSMFKMNFKLYSTFLKKFKIQGLDSRFKCLPFDNSPPKMSSWKHAEDLNVFFTILTIENHKKPNILAKLFYL